MLFVFIPVTYSINRVEMDLKIMRKLFVSVISQVEIWDFVTFMVFMIVDRVFHCTMFSAVINNGQIFSQQKKCTAHSMKVDICSVLALAVCS